MLNKALAGLCLTCVYVVFGYANLAAARAIPKPPSSPDPSNGATNVSTSVILTWSGSRATRYDVYVGNPLPSSPVATVTSPSYTPLGLKEGVKYHWRVVARNAFGYSASQRWSFKTAPAAPSAPTLPNPAPNATVVSTETALTWAASGATSYDVKFGTTSSPSLAVTGLKNASYSPPMVPGTTYFWQVTARNDGGATSGPVLSFSTAPAAPPVTTWTVNAGDDLQAVINKALLGDTILLQAGATFVGNFRLPLKSGSSYLTIRSSAPDSALPDERTRIKPTDAPQLPLIRGPRGAPALATDHGAHHYRLQALAFVSDGSGDVVTLGDGSAAQNSLSLVAHDLVMDRVYIHGNPAGQKRGVALNSASTSIINSHIDNIRARGQDSQAICGWNGPGPFTIVNNYLEAASENIMFGGADPAIPFLVPSDITIRHNHLFKPVSWRAESGWVIKNLFELKNAKGLVIDGNVFENVWLDGQTGYAISIGPRNQDGTAPWSTVQDVTFTNNVVRHAGAGITILGTDYIHPSGRVTNVVIRNNLWEDISGKTWGGQGRWILMEDGSVNVTFDHNTVFNDGDTTLLAENGVTTGFVFTNNIVPDNAWAILGNGVGNPTIATFFPNSIFLSNIIAGAPASRYPTGNYYPPSMSAVGFVNPAGGNYRLSASSPYNNAATDGTDVGVDLDALSAATGVTY